MAREHISLKPNKQRAVLQEAQNGNLPREQRDGEERLLRGEIPYKLLCNGIRS